MKIGKILIYLHSNKKHYRHGADFKLILPYRGRLSGQTR